MASTQLPNQTVKLTKSVVDRLTAPATGQAFYRDSELKGFALRVTAGGAKSFVMEKRIEGKVRRLTVARVGELTAEQARKKAQGLLGQVAMGINPIAEREKARLQAVTLEQAFAEFRRVRGSLKPQTLYAYERLLESAFSDWKTRSLGALTRDMVARRHAQLGENNGEAVANLAMRFLRSLFNFAKAHYEDGFGRTVLEENPVERLTRTRAWFRSQRRSTVIRPHQLKPWFDAVIALRSADASLSSVVSDYLALLLFSGLRRQEAAQLTWDRVDLQDRTLIIPDPKNHVPLLLPLSKPLIEILQRRQSHARNAFVFPGDGPAGYIIEPRCQVAKVIEVSGVMFTLHDLRRTFITMAESLSVPPYTIKRLVNHTMRNDVTAGYIVSDIERMRGPMELIADGLLIAAELKLRRRLVPRKRINEARPLIQG